MFSDVGIETGQCVGQVFAYHVFYEVLCPSFVGSIVFYEDFETCFFESIEIYGVYTMCVLWVGYILHRLFAMCPAIVQKPRVFRGWRRKIHTISKSLF